MCFFCVIFEKQLKTIIMKKTLLTGAFLFCSLFAMNAQTVVWSDNFNDESISDWTLTDSDGDGKNWGDLFQISDQDQVPITPVSLISRSWEAGVALSPNNWAVSPVINLSAHAGKTITLSFLRQTNAEFPADKYSVYVGTSNDPATLINATVTSTETPTDGSPTTKTVDLTSLAGQAAVYIAFRHYGSTDNDFISIDDVTVTAGDVAGVNDLLVSKLSVFPNPANDVVTISNGENILINKVEVVDLNGRTVVLSNFDGVSDAKINISNLSSGLYMMNISSDKGIVTKKIVKN